MSPSIPTPSSRISHIEFTVIKRIPHDSESMPTLRACFSGDSNCEYLPGRIINDADFVRLKLANA